MNFKVRVIEVKNDNKYFNLGDVLKIKDGKIQHKDHFVFQEEEVQDAHQLNKLYNDVTFKMVENIVIKNRDFSVLVGKQSIDKWGRETSIVSLIDWGEHNFISLDYKIDKFSRLTKEIILDNNSEIIKEEFLINGFEIEFEDAKEINSFKEFREFLNKKRLAFNEDYSSFDCFAVFEKDCGKIKDWKSAEEIEKLHNVKLNILEDGE